VSNTFKIASRIPAVVALGAWGSLIASAVACGGHTEVESTGGPDRGVGGTGAGAGSGGANSGGTSGAGGVRDPIPVDKIDLLFMIDNSRSMADKQEILNDAVPALLDRLVNPLCVDPDSGALSQPVGGQCQAPLEREFTAVDDIHIGIVTSSLGGHGADTCSPASGGLYDLRRRTTLAFCRACGGAFRRAFRNTTERAFWSGTRPASNNLRVRATAITWWQTSRSRCERPAKSAAVSSRRSKPGTAS
jgi:hypothetical protein